MFGQLGSGDTRDSHIPRLVSSLINFKITSVTCGLNFSLALSSDRQIFSWGMNSHGCLGVGDTENRLKPTPVIGLDGISVDDISAGEYHAMASSDQGLFSWGWNASGQLGIDSTEDIHHPVPVSVFQGGHILSISCGNAHSGAVISSSTEDRTAVYLWGNNACEQLGMEEVPFSHEPTAIKQLVDKDVVGIECGAFHTAAITDSGQVLLAGSNSKGQLGRGKGIVSSHLFQEPLVLTDKHVRTVFCGAFNTAFLVARQWVDDAETDSCMTCRKSFTMRIRRHHCRNCGGIFCNSCSSKSAAILKYGITKPVRVCDPCFVKLSR